MRWCMTWAVWLWGGAICFADPVFNFVYPAGGMPGSEFEVEVGGAVLPAVTRAVVSGEGVKALFLGPVQTVRRTKKGKVVRSAVPNRYRFKVVIENDAQPGVRAFRIGSVYRLSEPAGFEIASLPGFDEAVTNRVEAGDAAVPALPVCLNGRILGSEGDRYRFQAAEGATLVAYTVRETIPRSGFVPVLTFTDEAGNPCSGVTVYDAQTAPVAVFNVSRNGRYVLTVTSPSGCFGGDACVYRVKLGELPLITGFSPHGAKTGDSLNVKMEGYNLPQTRVRLFTGGKNSALCLATLSEDALVVSGLRFDLSDEPDADEAEPNDAPGQAQPIEVPCVVNGSLDSDGGCDFYRFSGTPGSVVYVDVRASSLGSALRPAVTVRNAQGEPVASGSFVTNVTRAATVMTRDPSVAVRLTEAGPYTVQVADASGRSGPDFFYRLRVGPPVPDFRVWMTPASLNIPGAGSMLVSVYLQRIHGFDGEVRVVLDFPPLSIASEGGVIPSGSDACLMTVSTDGVRFPRTVFGLSLTGTAEIGGQTVKRPAVPVRFDLDDGVARAQTFTEVSALSNTGLRALRLNVSPSAPVTIPVKQPVRLMVVSPTLATHLGGLYEPVVVYPEHGLAVYGVQHTNKQERAMLLLQADAKVMRPGDKGQFILGCVQKGDASRTVMAVTQSVPYVVK